MSDEARGERREGDDAVNEPVNDRVSDPSEGQNPDPDGGLSAVLPPVREIRLADGGQVIVRPLMFMQLARGARHVDGVIRAALDNGVLTDTGDVNLSALTGLIAEAGEHVNELILLCTVHPGGEPVDREWLAGVSVEDGLELTAAVIEVNWRGTIVKKLESLTTRIVRTMGQTGPGLSRH